MNSKQISMIVSLLDDKAHKLQWQRDGVRSIRTIIKDYTIILNNQSPYFPMTIMHNGIQCIAFIKQHSSLSNIWNKVHNKQAESQPFFDIYTFLDNA